MTKYLTPQNIPLCKQHNTGLDPWKWEEGGGQGGGGGGGGAEKGPPSNK